MCGIIGFSGKKQVKDILLDGLYSLEYRGYDSAGLAIKNNNSFSVVKSSGRVAKLDEVCKALELNGTCGIAHTRWATHGEPCEKNAHPHSSDMCTLVHNGIIENYIQLRDELKKEGYVFKSETDTECIVHLIDYEYKRNKNALESIRNAVNRLKGSFAFAVMFSDIDGEIWGCRRDNPLIICKNTDGTYIASDIPAILPYSKEILRPKDDEIICINGNDIKVYNEFDKLISYKTEQINWDVGTAQKEGFEHFMLKEIYEQPKAILRTVKDLINSQGIADLTKIGLIYDKLRKYDSISVIACGSATHAGLVGKHIIEKLAKIPVFVTTASEYRYCPPVTVGNCLTVAVSQSGETADTLAALRLAKANGFESLGIINSVGSAIARESDYVLYTNAGPEIAVATTKGYTTQLAAFVVLAVAIANARKTINENEGKEICKALTNDILDAMQKVISRREEIKDISQYLCKYKDLYFIGRGVDNYAGVECSLKLKEISYIHSEAYAAGELKHGTLSLVEEGTPVVALASDSKYYDKMIGNIREVISRGGKVILVCKEDFPSFKENSFKSFLLPDANVMPILSSLVSVVFAQLMAYETAVMLGCDVDHPRNLAKSVTVE